MESLSVGRKKNNNKKNYCTFDLFSFDLVYVTIKYSILMFGIETEDCGTEEKNGKLDTDKNI